MDGYAKPRLRSSSAAPKARRLLYVPVIACLAAIGLPHGAPAAEAVGEVAGARGKAFLARESGNELAAKGLPVLLDDTALTLDESRLDLALGRATRLRLGANASLKIDRFVAGLDTELSLERGPILIERWKGAEKKFEVKTPYALLAARGTEFFAGPSKGVFGVFVKSGILDVVTRQATVRLKAGQGTDFTAPGDPPSAVKIWAQPRVEEALWSVR